jgi:hypothetical protein
MRKWKLLVLMYRGAEANFAARKAPAARRAATRRPSYLHIDSGSFTMFAAIRRASSRLSSLVGSPLAGNLAVE